MLRSLGFIALLALSFGAQAVVNCTGGGALPNTCTAVTDPAPSTTAQPVTCNIYNSPAFIVASGPVSGPVGAKYCSIALPTFVAGSVTLTATFVGTDGVESPKSAPLTVVVGIPVVVPPLPAPTNLRLTNP